MTTYKSEDKSSKHFLVRRWMEMNGQLHTSKRAQVLLDRQNGAWTKNKLYPRGAEENILYLSS